MADSPLAYAGQDEPDEAQQQVSDDGLDDYFGESTAGAPTAGGLSGLGLDVPGAAQAFAAMTKSSNEARAALARAREQIVARRYSRAIPLLAISAALGKPTRTGSFGETLGNVSESLITPMRERRALEEAKQKELLGIDTQIAGLDQSAAQAQLQLAALQARLKQQEALSPNDRVIGPDGKVYYKSRPDARGQLAWTPPGAQTNVNVGERTLASTMAEGAGKQYNDQFNAALQAPNQIQRSGRVLDILDNGAYTGMGADFKLAFGKFARTMGIDYAGNDIQNTEQLASELANSTLGMIKASGLGGGTGFSNADRDFVEKASGGKINWDKETLRRIANLNIKAQQNVMKTWNDSYGRLSKFPANKLMLDQIGYTTFEIPQIGKKSAAPAVTTPPPQTQQQEDTGSDENNAPAVAPPEALAILKANPTPQNKAYFLQTFGYLPDGYQ